MKNLVLGSLIALTATGCIIESNGGDDAFITANWTFQNVATNTTTSCPPGFNTVALYNQEVDSVGNSIGAPIVDLFDCVDGTGTSAPLPPTLFLSWIEVTTDNNSGVYAQSTSAFVDVTTSDKSFSAQILNDGGYFEFAWNLYGAQTNADLSCAQAGATGGVDLTATVAGSTEANSDVFDCEDFRGITAGYRAANYTISVAALNSADQAIGVAPEIQAAIQTQNRVTSLGTVEIPIDGL